LQYFDLKPIVHYTALASLAMSRGVGLLNLVSTMVENPHSVEQLSHKQAQYWQSPAIQKTIKYIVIF